MEHAHIIWYFVLLIRMAFVCLFVWSLTPLSTALIISRRSVHLPMFSWLSHTSTYTTFFRSHWPLSHIDQRWEAMEKSPERMSPQPDIEPVTSRSRGRRKWTVPQENQLESNDPDQPKHAAQAYPERHFSPTVDFLFQESLLYASIPRDGMCRPGSVCADCAAWSGSIHYAEAIMLVFSRDGLNDVQKRRFDQN